MSGLVLLTLPVSIVVVAGIGLLMFLDVAFSPPAALKPRMLPLLKDGALRQWAVDRCRGIVRSWLGAHPKKTEAASLARTVERDAEAVLGETLFDQPPASRGLQLCREGCGAPQITVPEALAIVEDMRELPRREQDKIKQQASSAAKSGLNTCPLMTSLKMCACAVARPVSCRGRCLAGFDQSPDATVWANTFEDGLMEGMQQELTSAGLDGTRYDLNVALATLLTESDAESRWRRGEPLMISGSR